MPESQLWFVQSWAHVTTAMLRQSDTVLRPKQLPVTKPLCYGETPFCRLLKDLARPALGLWDFQT